MGAGEQIVAALGVLRTVLRVILAANVRGGIMNILSDSSNPQALSNSIIITPEKFGKMIKPPHHHQEF